MMRQRSKEYRLLWAIGILTVLCFIVSCALSRSSDGNSPLSNGHYCFEADTNGIISTIQFDIEGRIIRNGYADGELLSEAIHWSYTFTGEMKNDKAELEVVFNVEGMEEKVYETWIIKEDYLFIEGDERGTDGPYYFHRCPINDR